MKRLIILAVCAVVVSTSGCRMCGWLKRRGAPCRSSLSFDPYAAAPAECGVDAFAGQNVSAGYCPSCGPGGVADGPYYDGDLAPVPGVEMTSPPVNVGPSSVPPPVQP